MKKRGFTLAEVLITLGIIGVIAALTAPALVMSSRNEANAAKLSVTMSNLENAFTTMLVKENVDSLFQTQAFVNAGSKPAFAGHLAQYMHTNGYRDVSSGDGIKKYYGSNPEPCAMDAQGRRNESDSIAGNLAAAPNHNDGTNHVIELKNGATVFITPNENRHFDQAFRNEIINSGGSLFQEAADVFIDVNGVSSPNTLGRDIFSFYLGDNGILYPVGGSDVSIYESTGHDLSERWDSNAVSYFGCVDGKIQQGFGCTARIIEAGYKMTY